MLAAHGGHADTVRRLIRSRADVTVQDSGGFTALMCAADGGHLNVIKLLLCADGAKDSKSGLDLVSVKNGLGKTAADLARDSAHIEAAEEIAGFVATAKLGSNKRRRQIVGENTTAQDAAGAASCDGETDGHGHVKGALWWFSVKGIGFMLNETASALKARIQVFGREQLECEEMRSEKEKGTLQTVAHYLSNLEHKLNPAQVRRAHLSRTKCKIIFHDRRLDSYFNSYNDPVDRYKEWDDDSKNISEVLLQGPQSVYSVFDSLWGHILKPAAQNVIGGTQWLAKNCEDAFLGLILLGVKDKLFDPVIKGLPSPPPETAASHESNAVMHELKRFAHLASAAYATTTTLFESLMLEHFPKHHLVISQDACKKDYGGDYSLSGWASTVSAKI